MKIPMKSLPLVTFSIALIVIPDFIGHAFWYLFFSPKMEIIFYVAYLAPILAILAFWKGIKEENNIAIILSILAVLMSIIYTPIWQYLEYWIGF